MVRRYVGKMDPKSTTPNLGVGSREGKIPQQKLDGKIPVSQMGGVPNGDPLDTGLKGRG